MHPPRSATGPLATLVGAGLLLLAPTPGVGQDPAAVSLDAGWSRLVASDDVDRSGLRVDDARWPLTALSASWLEQGLTDAPGTVWYRKQVRLPADLARADARPGVYVGALTFGSYQLFADGTPVGSYGTERGWVPFPRGRIFELPRGVVADGVVTLALRVTPAPWATGVAGPEGFVFAGAYLGPTDRLEAAADLLVYEEREAAIGQLVFAIIALAVGLFHLLLFLGRLQDREYAWFGAGCLAFAVNALSISPWTSFAFLSFAVPYRLNTAAGHAATVLLLLFLWDIFARRRGRVLDGYLLSHLVLGALALVVPMTWVVATAGARFFWLFPGLAAALTILVMELRRGHPDSGALAFGVVAVALAEGAEFLRLSGAALPAFLPNAAFILALFAVATMLAGRYAREMAALDALRLTLERRVQERTAALAEATQRAHVANEAKSRFLTNMSHELRTPLNAVIGFSNVLLKRAQVTRGQLAPKELDFLERIRSNGMHLLALVDRVLDLSVIEAGAVELESRPVDLSLLINRVLADMSPQAEEKGIRLSSVVPTQTQTVVTDPVRLRQILTNLVDNGIKFTDEGSVTVAVIPVAGHPGRIEVTDTGPGIPQAHLARVLEAFSPADDSAARRHHGMGLGLAITRALCDLLGFHLTLRSTEGVGTTVSVALRPEARTSPGAAAWTPLPNRIGQGTPSTP